MGEVAERREVGGGLPVFHRKTGFSEYLRCKYSDSPRPSGTPLINAGGKKSTFIDKLSPGSEEPGDHAFEVTSAARRKKAAPLRERPQIHLEPFG